MPELVQTLEGVGTPARLRAAIRALIEALRKHEADAATAPLDDLTQVMAELSETKEVPLVEAQAACPEITTEACPAGEVYDNVWHMWVLSKAATILRDTAGLDLAKTRCAPTHQSAAPDDSPIPDLGEAPAWALEAYGGIDYVGNNRKIHNDLLSLVRWRTDHKYETLYLACRRDAWAKVKLLDEGKPTRAGYEFTQDRVKHRFKFLPSLIGIQDGVAVVRIDDLVYTAEDLPRADIDEQELGV